MRISLRYNETFDLKATDADPNQSSGEINPNAGYEYRRLSDVVKTGIYECNDFCKCKERKTCLNRVVQWPLKLRLQVSL